MSVRGCVGREGVIGAVMSAPVPFGGQSGIGMEMLRDGTPQLRPV